MCFDISEEKIKDTKQKISANLYYGASPNLRTGMEGRKTHHSPRRRRHNRHRRNRGTSREHVRVHRDNVCHYC